jgi:hypothetical protein
MKSILEKWVWQVDLIYFIVFSFVFFWTYPVDKIMSEELPHI